MSVEERGRVSSQGNVLVFTLMWEGLLNGRQVEPTRGGSRREAPGRLAKQQTPYPGPWSTPGLYVLNSVGKNDS